MKAIEFIEFDGKYPTFCAGTLKLRIDEEIFNFTDCLYYSGEEEPGYKWELKENFSTFSDVPISFKFDELYLIEKLINENLPKECCKGCY